MKVTKYPQSCLILEASGKRLAIDPGSFVSQKYKATELLPLDGILITHEHRDHADPKLLQALVGQSQIPVVANESTKNVLGDIVTQVVADQAEFEIAGFRIKACELPHVTMVDGSPGPQNTGYIIDGNFFHPGDGISTENLTVETSAVPIAGPDISPRDISNFVKQIGCNTVIPIHYDYFPNDPNFIANFLDSSIHVIVLGDGESAEV